MKAAHKALGVNQDAMVTSLADISIVDDGEEQETVSARASERARKERMERLEATWNRAELCLKGVDLAALSNRSPVPMRLLIRWFNAARLVRNIVLSDSMAEGEGTQRSPIAQQGAPCCDRTDCGCHSLLSCLLIDLALTVFDAIDTNHSGSISTEEVIAHFLPKYAQRLAHCQESIHWICICSLSSRVLMHCVGSTGTARASPSNS